MRDLYGIRFYQLLSWSPSSREETLLKRSRRARGPIFSLLHFFFFFLSVYLFFISPQKSPPPTNIFRSPTLLLRTVLDFRFQLQIVKDLDLTQDTRYIYYSNSCVLCTCGYIYKSPLSRSIQQNVSCINFEKIR